MSSDSVVNPVIKYLLFGFNFIFWVIGFVFIGLGIWAALEKDMGNIRDYYDVLTNPSIILIVVGCVTFLIGFCGCVGAVRENVVLLMLFYLFVGIILLIEIIGGVIIIVLSQEAYDAADKVVQRAIVRYRDDLDLRNFVDFVQIQLKCCGGKDGYQDWQNNRYFNCSDSNPSREKCGVPYSCCQPDPDGNDIINTQCGYDTTDKPAAAVSDEIYVTGCIDKLVVEINDSIYLFGGLAIGVALVQIIGIILARILHRQIDDQKELYHRNQKQNQYMT